MRLFPLIIGLAILAIGEIAVGLKPSLVESWPRPVLIVLELQHRWIDLAFGVTLLIVVIMVSIAEIWHKLRGSGNGDPAERVD
ncbi:hypothetical protein A5791_22345 [Mycobacterium sp. 852002-51163_SCH5372311]|uniref:hypothetical protein n=1 Tax=Mycobacterium sp. 852002-51163_SCH5372311 TaxID=1834097 RepID=UPI0007FD9DCC|nr:hypothetical protein [Mycobacterium sp. 852002-51163_SCH5372311]OBF85561.1 hypothetical protein A5791_22345 [Mycobacterium sp. 852002-51163_SCH5372311]